MVESISVISGAGSVITHSFIAEAIKTPNITGAIFLICFPVAEKPTIVNIEPIIGPFKSPFINITNSVAKRPFTPILKITVKSLNLSTKSGLFNPLCLSKSIYSCISLFFPV